MTMRFSRRDLFVALVAAGMTWGVIGVSTQTPAAPVLTATAFDWTALKETPTEVGSTRSIVRAPTATLDELEMHVTTLKPGQTSHAPHQHANEEIVIIREGTVEVLVSGVWKRLGPGSVIFQSSNSLHGLRNVGTVPTTYHVVNWTSPGMKKTQ